MASQATIEKRLAKLSEICLALPGVTREDKASHSTFLVGKKVFAYYLNEHDKDGIVSLCCKTLEGDNARLVEANPGKFYLPPYIGARGWVGYRLDLPAVDWSELKDLVRGSYQQTAPAKLLKLLKS
jgi:hypothetical protein